jgi:peroxiredoxin
MAIEVGVPLPDVALTGLDGREVRLRSLAGTGLLAIVFFRGAW